MHLTLLIAIQYLWETIQILLQFICSYPIIFFLLINNITKAAIVQHYGLFIFYFLFIYLKYASYLVDTYIIPMENYFKL